MSLAAGVAMTRRPCRWLDSPREVKPGESAGQRMDSPRHRGDPDIEGLWPGTDFVGVPPQRPDGPGPRN